MLHLSVRSLLALLFVVVRGEGPGDGNIRSFVPPTAGTASTGGQNNFLCEAFHHITSAAGFSLFISKTKLKSVLEKCLQDTKHKQEEQRIGLSGLDEWLRSFYQLSTVDLCEESYVELCWGYEPDTQILCGLSL